MSSLRTVGKVTALITRFIHHSPDILLLRHPLAGVQLPAGTMELRESPEEALWREIQEETGLTNLRLRQSLGTQTIRLAADQRIINRLSKLFDAPAYDASSLPHTFSRGTTVKLLAEENGYAQVCQEIYDLQATPYRFVEVITGWMRLSVLSQQVERHFFMVECSHPTPEQWSVAADGHLYELFWQSLRPRPRLISPQQTWLDDHYDRLLQSYA